ncbi:LYR motif-containing protein 2 [Entophlyctis helioformis]|nr:LYR motif-containing protein 2 [Entophlyctis helioformis]
MPTSRLPPVVMDLKQFMTRGRVLQLYRDILRTTHNIDPNDKEYVRQWARSDFERYRFEKDPDRIQTLLTQGKVQLRTLENSVILSKRKWKA